MWPAVRIAGLAVALVMAGCSKSPSPDQNATAEDTSAATPAPAPAPAPPVSAPPVATAPVPAATPVPAPKRLTPEGVFYVTQHISITTPDGISSVKPGTKVTLVKDLGATLRVTDGQMEFEATKDQLTNDLDIAQAAVGIATRQAGAIAAWQQAQRQGAQAMDRQKQQQATLNQQADTQSKSTRQLQDRHDFLIKENARLTALIEQSYAEEQREVHDRVILRRVTSKSELAKARPNLEVQLAGVNQELIQINDQLSRAR